MYRVLRPFLFRLDPESAHTRSFALAGAAGRTVPRVVRSLFAFEHPSLRLRLWGMDFANPVGLAAGADKNAETIAFWQQAGMGYVEIGSVTAQPRKGNPRPRVFRLPDDEAIINRMGLNNKGAEAIRNRLSQEAGQRVVPLGVNIAKTHDPGILGQEAIEDFRLAFRVLAPLSGYIALNVSCPNTAEGKTFEEPDSLDRLLTAIMADRGELGSNVPVLVKWSPPDTALDWEARFGELVACCQAHGIDGYIAANTAPDRLGLTADKAMLKRIGAGGLSGLPLGSRARRLLGYLYQNVPRNVPLISVGGIHSPQEAYRRIRLGASLLQLYTGLIYEGPGLTKRINRSLVGYLQRDGFENISDAVGADFR